MGSVGPNCFQKDSIKKWNCVLTGIDLHYCKLLQVKEKTFLFFADKDFIYKLSLSAWASVQRVDESYMNAFGERFSACRNLQGYNTYVLTRSFFLDSGSANRSYLIFANNDVFEFQSDTPQIEKLPKKDLDEILGRTIRECLND